MKMFPPCVSPVFPYHFPAVFATPETPFFSGTTVISRLRKHCGQVDGAIVQDADGDEGTSTIDGSGMVRAVFQGVDRYHAGGGGNDPVLAHSGTLVQVELRQLVMACGSWGKNLNHQVRRTVNAALVYLVFVAYHHQVWLKDGIHIF